MIAPVDAAPSAIIDAQDVSVILGGSPILTGVNLSVSRGEAVALLGANGSGKSTLVKALLGILPLATGSVSLLGKPLGAQTPWRRIGYVPQRLPATTGVPATASEVVRSGALAPGRWRRASASAALAALDRMGMADRASQPVQQMSGGQQQRVLIARALIREPDVLFLDEPTSGIDVGTVEAFVATLGHMRASGTSVVVVLHETEPFQGLLDRAVVLRHGRVVHDGAPPPARGEHADGGHVHVHGHGDELAAAELLGDHWA